MFDGSFISVAENSAALLFVWRAPLHLVEQEGSLLLCEVMKQKDQKYRKLLTVEHIYLTIGLIKSPVELPPIYSSI